MAIRKRDAIPPETRAEKSLIVARRLLGLQQYINAEAIHSFIPFGSEIDTTAIIEDAWFRKKRVICPRTHFKKKLLTHHEVCSWDDFTTGFAGIREPLKACRQVDVHEFDLILVPGMAFDTQGYRMGYGGGFYDIFLADSEAFKIAPAFEEQVTRKVPRCDHDQQVDLIITDHRIIECGNLI